LAPVLSVCSCDQTVGRTGIEPVHR